MRKQTNVNDPLDFCLDISHAHASLALKLDDELGTLHGLGYQDFLLLNQLARAEHGRMAVRELGRPLGLQLSAVTRQLVLLEKTGMVQREAGADGRRLVALRPGGRKVLASAMPTAAHVCADLLAAAAPAALPQVAELMRLVRRSPALDL